MTVLCFRNKSGENPCTKLSYQETMVYSIKSCREIHEHCTFFLVMSFSPRLYHMTISSNYVVICSNEYCLLWFFLNPASKLENL